MGNMSSQAESILWWVLGGSVVLFLIYLYLILSLDYIRDEDEDGIDVDKE